MSHDILMITIGDEILSGHTINTNAAYFGEEIKKAGLKVKKTIVVADDLVAIAKAINEGKKYQTIIVTGGLGPTSDDKTAEAAAIAFSEKFKKNTTAEKLLRNTLKTRKLKATPVRLKEAWMPKNATVLDNLWGTAPGFQYDFCLKLKTKPKEQIQTSKFYFLPGVPKECRSMFQRYILPKLDKQKAKIIQQKIWRCYGAKEADLVSGIDSIIRQWEKKYPNSFEFHCLIVRPYIDLEINIRHSKNQPSNKSTLALFQKIDKATKKYCIANAKKPLAEIISEYCIKKNLKIATAESCTGGLVSKLLTDVSGSSKFFLGGIVSYANEIKESKLQVKSATIRKYGAVSTNTAAEMAENVRLSFHADYSISLSGISGPSGASPEKPVGTLCLGLSSPNGTQSKQLVINNGQSNRESNRTKAAHIALNWLRQEIIAKN